MPPGELTSLQQCFQEAKPADIKSSRQFLHVDLILKHGTCQRLDFTVAIPRGPHFGQFPVALATMQTLLLSQADKERGISTCARTLAGTESSGKGLCDASWRYPWGRWSYPKKNSNFPLSRPESIEISALRGGF